MQIIYHGHSFLEIITEGWNILIDPFITGNSKCDITLDYYHDKHITHILLTHGHSDHVGDTIALCQQHADVAVVAMVELCQRLESKWVVHTESMNIGGTYRQEGRSVKFVRAFHSSSNPDGWYAGLAAWFIIKLWDKTIYDAGDTSLFAEMASFAKYNLDVAFLPIGDRYTMGLEDAVEAAHRIGAKTIVPIHYNTRDVIKADDIEFARQVMLHNYGVPKVLRAGQYVVL